MGPRRFRSLASRLILVGVVQLALLAANAIGIFYAEGPHHPGRPEEHIDRTLIVKLESLVDQPTQLQAALDALLDQRIEVSLYDDTKQLIATNVEPALAVPPRRPRGPRREGEGPPGPPPPGEGPGDPGGFGPGDRRGGGPPPWAMGNDRVMLLPFSAHGTRGYFVARGVHGEPPGLTGPVLVLVCGFVILVFGALVTARWIVRPIDRLSRTARALGAGDLQARSRLDRSDEIGELGHRFDEMADRVEGLLVSEKELLANVAHELRTPLTRIGVALDLAAEGDSEAARASLAEIAVDVGELETIVDDILTAMRFEVASGKGPTAQMPLRRAHVTAGSIAEAAADRLRGRHPQRSLVVTIDKDLPMVHADPMLLRRVLDNLLENAHKYTPDGTQTIELTATRDGDRVAYEVIDKGVGIPADDLPHVFTAFFRGERSRSRETGGVGLGLTLAKRITEAHGGTISATSQAAIGTQMRVTVPSA
ncbi:MAG: HAMP domain-containing sensor histidine kinase [Polyangiales bacterium]